MPWYIYFPQWGWSQTLHTKIHLLPLCHNSEPNVAPPVEMFAHPLLRFITKTNFIHKEVNNFDWAFKKKIQYENCPSNHIRMPKIIGKKRKHDDQKISYLSFGSQLVKTVRSLLSLMLSQGMSSSSADKDMAFTLSSRLNTLEDRQVERGKKIWVLNFEHNRSPSCTRSVLFFPPPPSHMSASRKRSSSILSVRTWAKCSEWFSLFLRAMNSGIFSKAPYLYAWMIYSEVWWGETDKQKEEKTGVSLTEALGSDTCDWPQLTKKSDQSGTNLHLSG